MANGTKDDDIREVMAEEKSRGRRPHDAKARKQRKDEMEVLRGIFATPREEDFVRSIRALGYGDDPKRFEEILKAWRAFSASRKR
jgi:hypothetical protein